MKHLFILLFTACTLLTYAQVPEGYPANYAKAPRFKALIYYTQFPRSCLQRQKHALALVR